MFTSLKAVAYRVSDLGKAKQWYREILDREPLFDSPIAVLFPVGDSMLSLSPATDPSPPGDPRVIPYWSVDDIDVALRRLLAAGATARGEIITTATRSLAATVVDPFGNLIGITSKPSATGNRSLDDQPSDTALGVTLFRAFATRDERDEIRGPDHLAEHFLPEHFRQMLDNAAAREWVKSKAPGSYEYFIARTAYFDAVVREALLGNLPQVVFLGAGYDSRPYRFRDLIRGTRIFELDVDSTQQRKIRLLRQAGIPIPAELTFVPVNFTRDNLLDILSKAGFDKAGKTLYVWEGVTYYLTAEAIDQTLDFVRTNSPAGSTLCFDYMADAPDMSSRYGVAESQALMRDTYHAEPVQFRIAEGTLESFLAARGYAALDHLTAGDLERKYLTLRVGSPAGKVIACFAIVRATPIKK
jgi:methyltransferase (TIGR00027 family)